MLWAVGIFALAGAFGGCVLRRLLRRGGLPLKFYLLPFLSACAFAFCAWGTVRTLAAASLEEVVLSLLTPRLLLQLFCVLLLLLACSIDVAIFILPDELTLFLAGSGLLYAWLYGSFWQQLAQAIALAALFYLGYCLTQGLGLGDVKLAGALGLWLNSTWSCWLFLLIAFSTGGLTALLCCLSGHAPSGKLPFGPFLALAALALIVCNEDLLALYQKLFIKF